MKYIPLTKGKFAIVDDNDFDRVNNYNWSFLVNGKNGYAVRSIVVGYRDPLKPKGDSTNQIMEMIYMHRFILNAPKGVPIDHKDLNKLNNQKSNIRLASKAMNTVNRIIRPDNTSGFKGVSIHKKSGKWRVRIKIDGKEKSLGYFDNKLEAAKAYNEGAKKYYGEYARLNYL